AGTSTRLIAGTDTYCAKVPSRGCIEKAALTEPLAVSWHSVRLGLAALSEGSGSSALVIGGGTIGFAASLALKAMGVADVTVAEPNAARAAFLETLGEKVTTKPEGSWPLVVDAVGYAITRATASELSEPGGVIVHIGLGEDAGGLDIRRMTLQEITFIGTYTYTAEDFRDTAAAMFSGRLGPLDWVEQRPLAEGQQAFRDIQSHKVAVPKIILSPWH
ncbi:MAG: zinc-binding dehydrogenase, partial [Pseudomonadota bacterium]